MVPKPSQETDKNLVQGRLLASANGKEHGLEETRIEFNKSTVLPCRQLRLLYIRFEAWDFQTMKKFCHPRRDLDLLDHCPSPPPEGDVCAYFDFSYTQPQSSVAKERSISNLMLITEQIDRSLFRSDIETALSENGIDCVKYQTENSTCSAFVSDKGPPKFNLLLWKTCFNWNFANQTGQRNRTTQLTIWTIDNGLVLSLTQMFHHS